MKPSSLRGISIAARGRRDAAVRGRATRSPPVVATRAIAARGRRATRSPPWLACDGAPEGAMREIGDPTLKPSALIRICRRSLKPSSRVVAFRDAPWSSRRDCRAWWPRRDRRPWLAL
ncbi:MAG: hypothetical protein H6946_05605 [Thauera sp.]|uniref:hypothetical protein n=1 Tax=Thauera sp. TaxID=1905334 RepID=UPI00261A275D|nr:hypothetical protein [Thauera sp.]MCP5224600.1 hypothetical protein [Thauera sp.]